MVSSTARASRAEDALYSCTVSSPYSSLSRLISARPFSFAAICARKSDSTSLKHLEPEQPGYLAGSSTIRRYSSSRWNLPFSTILNDLICAPSSKIVRDEGGILPAVLPPMSA